MTRNALFILLFSTLLGSSCTTENAGEIAPSFSDNTVALYSELLLLKESMVRITPFPAQQFQQGKDSLFAHYRTSEVAFLRTMDRIVSSTTEAPLFFQRVQQKIQEIRLNTPTP